MVEFRERNPERYYAISHWSWDLIERPAEGSLLKLQRHLEYNFRDLLGICWMLILSLIGVFVGFVFGPPGLGWASIAVGVFSTWCLAGLRYIDDASLKDSPTVVLEVFENGRRSLFDGRIELDAAAEIVIECIILSPEAFRWRNEGESSSSFSELNLVVSSGESEQVFELLACTGEVSIIHAKRLAELTGWRRVTRRYRIPDEKSVL